MKLRISIAFRRLSDEVGLLILQFSYILLVLVGLVIQTHC